MNSKEQSFEEMIVQLEQILKDLEAGDKPLSEMISLYTQGVELAGLCRAKLDLAEEALEEGNNKINGEEKCD